MPDTARFVPSGARQSRRHRFLLHLIYTGAFQQQASLVHVPPSSLVVLSRPASSPLNALVGADSAKPDTGQCWMLLPARTQTHTWFMPQVGCAAAGPCFFSHSGNTAARQPGPGLWLEDIPSPSSCLLPRVAASLFSLPMVLKNMLPPSFTHCPVITSSRHLPEQRLCRAGYLQDSE